MDEQRRRKPKPVPRPSPETLPFWEAARAHRLLLPRCKACGRFWFPPTRAAPIACRRISLARIAGAGRIYSFVIYHRVYHPAFEGDVPYVVAIVELDEGPRSHQQYCRSVAPDEVRCDMRVKVIFDEIEPGDHDPEIFRAASMRMAGSVRSLTRPKYSPLVLGMMLVLLVLMVPPTIYLIRSILARNEFRRLVRRSDAALLSRARGERSLSPACAQFRHLRARLRPRSRLSSAARRPGSSSAPTRLCAAYGHRRHRLARHPECALHDFVPAAVGAHRPAQSVADVGDGFDGPGVQRLLAWAA